MAELIWALRLMADPTSCGGFGEGTSDPGGWWFAWWTPTYCDVGWTVWFSAAGFGGGWKTERAGVGAQSDLALCR